VCVNEWWSQIASCIETKALTNGVERDRGGLVLAKKKGGVPNPARANGGERLGCGGHAQKGAESGGGKENLDGGQRGDSGQKEEAGSEPKHATGVNWGQKVAVRCGQKDIVRTKKERESKAGNKCGGVGGNSEAVILSGYKGGWCNTTSIVVQRGE